MAGISFVGQPGDPDVGSRVFAYIKISGRPTLRQEPGDQLDDGSRGLVDRVLMVANEALFEEATQRPTVDIAN